MCTRTGAAVKHDARRRGALLRIRHVACVRSKTGLATSAFRR